jgi:rod shape-determining protein MreD
VPISQKLKKSWWVRPLLYEQEGDAATEKKKSASRLLTLCGIFAVVLQTTLLPHLPVIPDLLLIFCVYLAIYHCSAGGAAGAFLLGYSLDSCSGAPMGMNAFAMSLVFAVTTATARCLWLNNPLSVFFMIMLAVVLKTGAFLLWGEFGQLTAAVQEVVSEVVLREAVAALILTPLIFSILYHGEEFGYRT